MLAQEIVRIETPGIDWAALAPILILIGGAALLLVVDALSLRRPAAGVRSLYTVVVAGLDRVVGAARQEVRDPERGPFSIVRGALGIDGFSIFFFVVLAAAVLLAALLADGYLRREGLDGPEFYVLVMLSASGGMVMAAANDLIVTFLGLEILSIAVYVLAAMHLRRSESQEAAIKYFVLGAFSSAFFLYGIVLVYGATGTTRLAGIAAFAPASGGGTFGPTVSTGELLQSLDNPALLLAGIALLLVGFGFKVAAVPFHTWTPDVYQGSPSPAVAFMASGVKAAGFAGMIRVLLTAFGGYAVDWQPYVYALAVATLLVGSILAIVQTDVKRMLAYSSISHAGFILVGVQSATERGISGALFYLAAYTFVVAGSFGVITVVSRVGDDATTLDDFRGLSKRRPVLAFTFAIFLLAQLGAPFTSGFVAKFEVLAAAAEAGSWWLALVAMISAVIGAYLYLRVLVAMYMADDDEATANARAGADHAKVPFGAALALGLAAAVTLLVGFLPGLLDDLTDDANPVIDAPSQQDEVAVP